MNNQDILQITIKNIIEVKVAALLVFVLFFLQAQDVRATPILVWNNSNQEQLIGARNVEVMDVLFDVRFIDASCNAIWSGCDRNKFMFPLESLALAASEALLDQVLIDVLPLITLDSNPWKVAGIEGDDGYIFTPYASSPNSDQLSVSWAGNAGANNTSWLDQFNIDETVDKDWDLLTNKHSVYAKWSVPEPASATLLAFGLAGLALSCRKRKRAA